MAFCIDVIDRCVNGVASTEPITVTITLEEYRSLVSDNAKYWEEICYMRNTIDQLESELERFRAANGR